MAEYISADWLKERIHIMNRDACESCTDIDCAECYIGLVDMAPRENADPVVHGRWLVVDVSPEYERENGELKIVDNTIEEQCELCGMRVFRYATEKMWNYCPNCGARMDKGVQDG